MTTEAKILSNQENALRSTGPRTAEGKERSAMNRLSHGLRSNVVVIPGEDVEEWERFRTEIVQSFDPANALERELAGRVAIGLWRMRRCAMLESLIAEADAEAKSIPSQDDPSAWFAEVQGKDGMGHARRWVIAARSHVVPLEDTLRNLQGPSPLLDLPGLSDDAKIDPGVVSQMLNDFFEVVGEQQTEFYYKNAQFFRSVGVPESFAKRPWRWDGWTAKLVRVALASMADSMKVNLEETLRTAPQVREDRREQTRKQLETKKAALEAAQAAVQVIRLGQLLKAIAPTSDFHIRLSRYELLHHRQTLDTMRTLDFLQCRRRDQESTVKGDK